MCGICGVSSGRGGEPVAKELIERMLRMISHRGPDDGGDYLDGDVGLGFARLSIIDPDGGHQPMSNETNDTWLICNGEIWNYKELRNELIGKGHHFRTHCDVEAITHAYEEYGFASEIKALLCHPRLQRRVDVQALADFLSVRYVPGPATLFANIYKVQPGHWLLCENGVLHEECYWDFTFDQTERRPVEEYMQGIRQGIHRSVEERMMADVPLGALLRGGVDSSIIVGTLSQLMKQPVKTFSVGFDVPGYGELPYAHLVAEHFGTEHRELVLHGSDFATYWPLLTWHRDEPVSEASDLGVYLISKLARQHVHVVQSGEGGDELFAGYPKYVYDWMARYYHVLPPSIRNQVITPLLFRLPYGMRRLQFAARTLSQTAPERWMDWFGVFNAQLKDKVLSASTKASITADSARVFRQWLEKNAQRDDLSSMLYLDTKIWLPDNLLMKGDKMSMAASLEVRMPFLDYQLIEYAASIPSHIKIKPFQAKYLLKQAFADFLPAPILTRKKMGFNVPVDTWFRGEQRDLLAQLLLSDRARGRGFLNNTFVERLLRDHLEGRTNYRIQLFILASLEIWFRVFIDGSRLECPQESVEDLLGDKSAVPRSYIR